MKPTLGHLPNMLGAALICLPVQSRAQFNALPDHHAQWVVHLYDGPDFLGEESYSLSDTPGDTLIDSEPFTRLYFGATPIGALRDNGIGQVHFHSYDDQTTHLLYDFAVSTGDTVSVYNQPYFTTPLYITGVDSVQYAGQWRRRIGVSESSTSTDAGSYWVQGIGGIEGDFWSGGLLSTCACLTVSISYRLFCASANDTIQYGLGEGMPGGCSIAQNVSENSYYAVDCRAGLDAHPNPSTGVFKLTGEQPRSFSVTNAQGLVVVTDRSLQIDLIGQPPGLYVALIETPRGVQSLRLVVER